jgi:hypothetical protein
MVTEKASFTQGRNKIGKNPSLKARTRVLPRLRTNHQFSWI